MNLNMIIRIFYLFKQRLLEEIVTALKIKLPRRKKMNLAKHYTENVEAIDTIGKAGHFGI